MNINDFQKFKLEKKPISMVTAYDYPTAQWVSQSQVDAILVGDSVAMVCHGFPSTLHATIEMMELHTAAVHRGRAGKFLIADLPFGSYRKSIPETVAHSVTLLQAGAEAVKLEGAEGNLQTIEHLVTSGIPVMGHIGLTPQFVNQFGGHRVQGKDQQQADRILQQAIQLQEAGCFSLVVECVPEPLAKNITEALKIPTIGIGAGPNTDGQVLVSHDLLGYQSTFTPKFVRRYDNFEGQAVDALNRFHEDVTRKEFPKEGEWY